jgi:hypothetical protein
MERQRALTLLRWIAVLPVAVGGAILVKVVGGLIGRALRQGLGSDSHSGFALQLLVYVATAAAFVLAGAAIAPRHRPVIAIILAALWVLLSLMTHVVSQPHPGTTNYLHLAAETSGAVFAVACVAYREKNLRAPPR